MLSMGSLCNYANVASGVEIINHFNILCPLSGSHERTFMNNPG